MTKAAVEIPFNKHNLSAPRIRLVEKMQEVNYGKIHHLQVRDGEPVFTPMTRVERQIKFGGDNRPRPECALDDFILKGQVVELFDAFARLGDGTIKQLEIKGGLPFGMTVDEPAV